VLAQAFIAFIFFGTTALAAADLDELEKLLLQAVIDAMHSAHLTVKELAFAMRMDEKQLRRQLEGQPHQHLALVKLFRAPFSFWTWFGPSLIALIARKRFAELTEDFRRERA
jgi:hypothetical protein